MMTPTPKHPSPPLAREGRLLQWPFLPIGRRLFIGFMAIIVLTALIGVLAVHRLRALSAATAELVSRDLPEGLAVQGLRVALFQQRSLEQRLVSSDEHDTAGDLAALQAALNQVSTQRAILMGFESPDALSATPNDAGPMHQLEAGIPKSLVLSKQIQDLVKSGRLEEARAIENNQQAPLLQSLLDATARLRDLEQQEVAAAAAQVQQQSNQATATILALTLLSVPLSVLLAVLVTRSLTKPLSSLVQVTRAAATGEAASEAPTVPSDELRQLASAFGSMNLNLRTAIASLAQERAQTQGIIDASADGMMLVDAERSILQFNPAAERLTGWKQGEAIGRHCWEVFGCRDVSPEEGEEHERLCPILLASQTNSAQSATELLTASRGGERRWRSISCAPLAGGASEPRRMVVGIHDISELKQVEQLKSDFVAMVSHELRAPLSTVSGSVETLTLLDPAGDREAYQEVLGLLQQQTQRLREVVEEVLQLTRVEAGRLRVHLQPLSLREFLQTTLESTRLAWIGDDRPLVLRAPDGLRPVQADRDVLQIVVRNLLDNARKYSPASSPIEVEVEPAPGADQVLVHISDHGSGIPPEQLERIFERFSRGARTSHGWRRGYGLGLYIARELIRAQEGQIWAENRAEDGGACLTFSLRTATGEPKQEDQWGTHGQQAGNFPMSSGEQAPD